MGESLQSRMLEIPEIDFGPFVEGEESDRKAVADQINTACRTFGFMNIKHLPFPGHLIRQVFDQTKQFFALPRETKDLIGRSDTDAISGYIGVEGEHLDPRHAGDLKEGFSVNRASLPLLDTWPISADLRATLLAFYEAGASASSILMRAIALSVGAPENVFEDKHNRHSSTVRLFHYPGVDTARRAGQLRAGTHTDYGSITLVFQGEGGLEALVGGRWLTVPHVPGAVTVNVADLLSRWTNGRFRSPEHRVALPAQSQRSRYSAVFFYNPNSNATITCLDSCREPEGSRYPPVTAGEFLRQRREASYE
jgi:isopenicillin N synthase-like dioxygenase